MERQTLIISFFVLLNLGMGLLFQQSLGILCISELAILAVFGFLYWNGIANRINQWSRKLTFKTSIANLALQGVIGTTVSATSVLLGQVLVILLMTTFYSCSTPSFDFLNASLTNNMGINLFCYMALFFQYGTENKSIQTSLNDHTFLPSNYRIPLTKNGSVFHLAQSEIEYISASGNCVLFHTTKGKFVKYGSLKSMQSLLCKDSFIKVHRSFLVNRDHIEHIRKKRSGDGTIYLSSGETVRFSRTYRDSVSRL